MIWVNFSSLGFQFWGIEVGESVDFIRVLRYWVRYLIFMAKVDEVLDFTGFDGILVEWFDF